MNFSKWRELHQLKEATKDLNEILDEFISYAKKFLKLKDHPKINFIKDGNFAKKINAFGEISSSNKIDIDIKDRQPMDILRTLAHELTHYQQHQKGIRGNAKAGSPTEDKANALAGEMIRKFGEIHSEYFKLKSVK